MPGVYLLLKVTQSVGMHLSIDHSNQTFNIDAVSYIGCGGSIGDMVLIHSRISACHIQFTVIETVPESSGIS